MGKTWNNYGPVLVMVPALAAIHWGWFALQQRMVPPEQQVTEQPIISVSHRNSIESRLIIPI